MFYDIEYEFTVYFRVLKALGRGCGKVLSLYRSLHTIDTRLILNPRYSFSLLPIPAHSLLFLPKKF
jgi:hypothetical protein